MLIQEQDVCSYKKKLARARRKGYRVLSHGADNDGGQWAYLAEK